MATKPVYTEFTNPAVKEGQVKAFFQNLVTYYNDITDGLLNGFAATTEPAVIVEYMWWIDLNNNQIKQRNAANDAWVVKGTITADGIVWSIPAHNHDANTITSGVLSLDRIPTMDLTKIPTGLKTRGLGFCLINPAVDAESARYILRSNKTATEVKVISTTAPTSAITIKVYQNSTEIASFSHATTSTTFDINPNVSLSVDDVIYAKISGAPNGVTNITIELTVVDR